MSHQPSVQSLHPVRPGPSQPPLPTRLSVEPLPRLPEVQPQWIYAAQPHVALALLMY